MIIALAPMEGVVDPIIRDIYTRIGGYNLCVTEFVRVTSQLLPAKVFYRYSPELHNQGRTPSGVPCFIQLLGSDPECLLDNALRAIELGALGIDLNFGCPAKTVNNHDGGSKLLLNPERLFKIIDKLRSNIDSSIPVTAKVRLGYEDKSKCVDIAKACDEANASWMMVHARTKREAYKPPAKWEYIAQMKEAVKLPVWANGDIWSLEDYKKCREQSKCPDAVLGRSAFAKPDLALEIHNAFPNETSPVEEAFPQLKLQTKEFKAIHWQQMEELYVYFGQYCIQSNNEDFALKRSKQWIKFLGRNYPEANAYFEDIKRFKEMSELLNYQQKSLNWESIPQLSQWSPYNT